MCSIRTLVGDVNDRQEGEREGKTRKKVRRPKTPDRKASFHA